MLKRLLLITTFSIAFSRLSYSLIADPLYPMTLMLNNLADQTVNLGYSYGTKILLSEKIKLDAEGSGAYNGIDHEGIYFLRLPDSSAYEFIVDRPGIYTIKSDDGKIIIDGNPATEAYDRYLKSVRRELMQIDSLKKGMDTLRNKLHIKSLQTRIAESKIRIDSMTSALADQYRGSFLGSYARALIPVKSSSFLPNERKQAADSLNFRKMLYLYRAHYFNNIDFYDNRLIYTPVIEDKIFSYLDRLIPNTPDSLNKAIDLLLTKSSEPKMTQYIATILLQKYHKERFSDTGEKVYIHLIQDFYLTGKAFWLSDKDTQLLAGELEKTEHIATGNIAPELILDDISGRKCSLYAVQSELIALIFWDFSCQDCRRIIQDFINLTKKYFYLNMQVFSVYTGNDLDVWKAWYYKKLPGSWINTYQDPDQPVSMQYNITHVPAIFILDQNKVILKKNITIPELDEFLFQFAEK